MEERSFIIADMYAVFWDLKNAFAVGYESSSKNVGFLGSEAIEEFKERFGIDLRSIERLDLEKMFENESEAEKAKDFIDDRYIQITTLSVYPAFQILTSHYDVAEMKELIENDPGGILFEYESDNCPVAYPNDDWYIFAEVATIYLEGSRPVEEIARITAEFVDDEYNEDSPGKTYYCRWKGREFSIFVSFYQGTVPEIEADEDLLEEMLEEGEKITVWDILENGAEEKQKNKPSKRSSAKPNP